MTEKYTDIYGNDAYVPNGTTTKENTEWEWEPKEETGEEVEEWEEEWEEDDILAEYTLHSLYNKQRYSYIGESLFRFMSPEDQETYNNFPDEITVYRGASTRAIESPGKIGQSWTTDIAMARRFAWELTNAVIGSVEDLEKRVVLQATIEKRDIYGYTSGRNESECIVEIDNLQDVKIIERCSKERLEKFREKKKQEKIRDNNGEW